MGLHAGRRRSKRAARLQRADLRARDGNNGRYYPQADARLANNPDLAPGINCCAVCARQFITKVCPVSRRVRYCSAHHMIMDAKARAPSMRVLRTLEMLKDDGARPIEHELGLALRQRRLRSCRSRRRRGAESIVVSAERGARLPRLSALRQETSAPRATRFASCHRGRDEAGAAPHVWLDCFVAGRAARSFTVVLVGPELSPQEPAEAWKAT